MEKTLRFSKKPRVDIPGFSLKRPNTSFSVIDSAQPVRLYKNHTSKYSPAKDPTIKKHRFDYQIFFKKRPSSEQKSFSIRQKKSGTSFPARYCSVDNKKPKVNCEIGSSDDLQLIKTINFDAEMQELKNVKVYRSYVLNLQVPAGCENFSDRRILAGKNKHVRFNLV